MKMTKELEARLKLMSRFNQVTSRRGKVSVYTDKIFVHDKIMYATDGHIFVYADNLTDNEAFSFFAGKKFVYKDDREAKEDAEYLNNGARLERIISQFNYYPLCFDINFEDYPLPAKLMGNWSNRYINNLCTINFQTEECTFDFEGGADSIGGVTGIYGDILQNIEGEKPEAELKIQIWFILEIMKVCKVKKIHIQCYPERKHYTCKVGDYTFIFMGADCQLGEIMVDVTYNGITYKMVLNKNVFQAINVLFAGYIFLNGKQFKKYVNCNNQVYLVEV